MSTLTPIAAASQIWTTFSASKKPPRRLSFSTMRSQASRRASSSIAFADHTDSSRITGTPDWARTCAAPVMSA